MIRQRLLRRVSVIAAASALVLGLAACGNGDDGDEGANEQEKTIELGIIPSWTDGLATAYLWKAVLEEEGYEVNITDINDAAPLYTGVAQGDIDIYPSAWSEVTHAAYMEEYGDQLEDLGAYYEGAGLNLSVPEYSSITSIEELADNADLFGDRIVGIEAGAGLTNATKNDVMPAYGLGDAGFELVESSTTAMLAELERAIDDEQEIVVTLWTPFWANAVYPVRALEDPEGAFGELEALHAIATLGFSDRFPEVADMFANFKLDVDAFGSLEQLVTDAEFEGNPAGAVEAWLEANPDFIDGLKG